VKVFLPRHFGSSGDKGEKLRPDALSANLSGWETVLVVEDEDRVRQMSSAALRELGYTVHEAASGEEALAMSESIDGIELVFTDVIMAGMTGRQLADALHARNPAIKVLYTTGYMRNAVSQSGVLDADVVLLSKPFSVEELARKVRLALDSD
jgi:CheY-like chemotaxis protein